MKLPRLASAAADCDLTGRMAVKVEGKGNYLAQLVMSDLKVGLLSSEVRPSALGGILAAHAQEAYIRFRISQSSKCAPTHRQRKLHPL